MSISRELTKYTRIVRLSSQRFFAEKRVLWAASLTYTTIFSLVPLLSVLFFVFNIFGDLAHLKTIILPYVYKTLAPGAQENVVHLINDTVEHINFKTIGVLSTTVLVVSVFFLLFEIEYALNDIWLIKHRLSVISRAAMYWAALTIGPLAVAVTLFLVTTFENYPLVKNIEHYIHTDYVFRLSFVLIWLAFTGIYFFMPGTRVKFWSSMFGGVIAGTLWKVAQCAFTLYTSKFLFYYPKVYGSLAAVPLFLLWIFLCWTLLLFGAELAYFHQNEQFYKSSYKLPELNLRSKQYISAMILVFIGSKFHEGKMPPSLSDIAHGLNMPVCIIREFIEPLQLSGIIVQAQRKGICFLPGRPLEKIRLAEVFEQIMQSDTSTDFIKQRYQNIQTGKMIDVLGSLHEDAYADKSLKDLLEKHTT